jgi:hypothetical protein
MILAQSKEAPYMKHLVPSRGRHPYQGYTLILGAFLRTSEHEVSLTKNALVLAYAAEVEAAIKAVERLSFT